jgi:hypothetical protein
VIPRDQETHHFANMLSKQTAATESALSLSRPETPHLILNIVPTESTKPFDKAEKIHEKKQHTPSEEVPGFVFITQHWRFDHISKQEAVQGDTEILDLPKRKKQVPVTSTRGMQACLR